MRTQETINLVNKANSLEVSMTFNKSVFYSDAHTVMSRMKKGEAFEYLSGVSEASVKIEHTQKVVASTIKKIESLGFSVELVESVVMDWGATHHWVIIKK